MEVAGVFVGDALRLLRISPSLSDPLAWISLASCPVISLCFLVRALTTVTSKYLCLH